MGHIYLKVAQIFALIKSCLQTLKQHDHQAMYS